MSSGQLEAGNALELPEILLQQGCELACGGGQMLPMPEGPADRDRRQIADEHCFDCARSGEVVRVNGRHDGLAEVELHKNSRCIEIVEDHLRIQSHPALERRFLDAAV